MKGFFSHKNTVIGTPSSPSEDYFPHPHLLPAGKTRRRISISSDNFSFISVREQQAFSPLKTGGEYSKSTEALIGSVCSTFRTENLSLTSVEVITFILAPFHEWRDRTI